MAGGKGKSIGGKGAPGKDAAGKTQKSHSAKAGLQVSCFCFYYVVVASEYSFTLFTISFAMVLLCDTDTVMKQCKLSTFTRRVECAGRDDVLYYSEQSILGKMLRSYLSRVFVE